MDTHTKAQRSFNMSRIKSSNTKTELLFRRYIWKRGLRGYRIKNNILGKPDLYFPKNRIAVFIDGCFWHKCPVDFIKPKSKNNYWDKKIKNNVTRDGKNSRMLQIMEIYVIRIWEHEIKDNLEKSYKKLKVIYDKTNKNN